MADQSGSARRCSRQYQSEAACDACGADFVRRSHNQKYCGDCRERVYREDNRKNEERKRRSLGILPIGSDVDCPSCGNVYQRVNGAQRDCPSCADKRRSVYTRASRKKYEANNPPRKRNSEKDKARQKRWNLKNRERRRRQAQTYNDRNRDQVNRKARERNGTQKRRSYLRQWEAERKATDPRFTLNCRIRTSLRRGLREGKGGRAWPDLVGYSVAQLADHLERQFLPGMSWSNMGEWHIDHRQPLSSFRFETAEDPEFKAAWALTNLQPLWNKDNLSKGGKRLLLL